MFDVPIATCALPFYARLVVGITQQWLFQRAQISSPSLVSEGWTSFQNAIVEVAAQTTSLDFAVILSRGSFMTTKHVDSIFLHVQVPFEKKEESADEECAYRRIMRRLSMLLQPTSSFPLSR